jgi:hypothetical protein
VEVDIFRVGDELQVAHSQRDLNPERTLESLYLRPLEGRAESVTLVIDLKTSGDWTWERLRQVLGEFAHLRPRLEVLLTGNRVNPTLLQGLARREGTLAELDGPLDPAQVPQVSGRWTPGQDLRALAERAHARGVRLRLWGGPDERAAWQAQRDAGVDRINTDQPGLLAEFLRGGAASPCR